MNNDELYQLVLSVNKVFYDKVYKDPWLSPMFSIIDQEIIELQQTDFMVGALGGEKKYCGRNPKDAHPHLYITEEIWQLREKYLKESFEELDITIDIRQRWLKIDEAFKRVIVKSSVDECEKRYFTDEIIILEKKAA